MSMESSPTNYQHTSRLSSGLNTIPSLSISTSTSCVSSVLSTSPVTSDSPYYYYTSPTSASSSPTTTNSTSIAPCPLRQSHRSHSASVRLRRRTSIPILPPQRSASAGSTLIKDTSSSAHYHQQQHYRPSFHRPTEKMEDHSNTTFVDKLPPPKEQRWDDSQLAMELADDLPSSPTLSTRENIKIKVRQWITPNTKQRRRPIHKWFSDRMA